MRPLVLAVGVVSAVASAQTIFHWVDADGQDHFTNELTAVPKRYRAKAMKAAALDGDRDEPVAAAVADAGTSGDSAFTRTNPPPPEKPVVLKRPTEPEPTARTSGTIVLGPMPDTISATDQAVIRRAVATVTAGSAFVWLGGLREDVRVDVVASDAELAAHGAPAWAGGFATSSTQVFLCGPSVGALAIRPRPYVEVLTHEVAHAVQLQLTGRVHLPRWFTEGFAMYVAGDDSAAALDDLAWFSHQTKGRPLEAAFGQLKSREDVVTAYGMATYGFRKLIEKTGRSGMVDLLESIREGTAFEAALQKHAGLSLAELDGAVAESLAPHFHERATAP